MNIRATVSFYLDGISHNNLVSKLIIKNEIYQSFKDLGLVIANIAKF